MDEAELKSVIEGACERIQHLVESGCLSEALQCDLKLIMKVAAGQNLHVIHGGGNIAYKPATLIKRARKAKGFSQLQLAKRVGTTQQTIDRIEAGQIEYSSFFPAIAEELGIDRRLLDRAGLNG